MKSFRIDAVVFKIKVIFLSRSFTFRYNFTPDLLRYDIPYTRLSHRQGHRQYDELAP